MEMMYKWMEAGTELGIKVNQPTNFPSSAYWEGLDA